MSNNDRKPRNRQQLKNGSSLSNDRELVRTSHKSPIAAPPRVALHGRVSSREGQQSGETSPSISSPEQESGSAPAKVISPTHENGEDKSSKMGDPSSKIATLEIEMAKMEDEFSRELLQLGEKLANENELSVYWQQKYSALNQQFLKADTDLRVLRQEVSIRERDEEERDRDLMTRVSSLMLDRDKLKEAYHASKARQWELEEEVGQLRTQIKGLKDFVSQNSRKDGQVTDEMLGEMMRGLGNSLQNWVIVNFRKQKISKSTTGRQNRRILSDRLDINNLDESLKDELLMLVPTYDTLASSAKIHLIQSIVSRIFVLEVFDAYYVGIPPGRASELRNIETYLSSLTEDPTSVNQWRSTTLAVLRKNTSKELENATELFTNSLLLRIDTILCNLTDGQSTPARFQSLRVLLQSAIDLSRLLRVQKAIFKATMPVIEAHQINTFEGELMEDIGGEEEDGLEGREIRCVTFPGITKEGDESGEQSQLRNVIAKVRVLCSPD